MYTFFSLTSTVSPGSPMTRLMKSRSGSTGYLNTMTSPRLMVPIGRSARSSRDSVGPKMNLFTSRWSPISRFSSIEPVGILNACTTNVRMKSARITAMTIDSKYSRTIDFLNGSAILISDSALRFGSHPEHRQEGLLRDLDSADTLHPLFPFLLLLQQLALAADIAAVALGQHVLAQRLDRFPGDDAAADGRLDGDLEHLPWNQLAHLRRQRAAALVGHVAVHDDRQRVDRIAVDQDVELHQRRRPVAGHMVVERGVAA